MTKDEALKMALEALLVENYCSSDRIKRECRDHAIESIRQALAEPQTMSVSELANRIKRGEKWKVAEPSQKIKNRRELLDNLVAAQKEVLDHFWSNHD